MTVKLNLSRLSDHYLAALRAHLAEGPRARRQPAALLGREAVGLGLETLELARIHERALAALELPATPNARLKRAEKFFNEANSSIEETHRAARQGGQVIAQDRLTSQDFSMPETSIQTGDVDFILPLDQIAPKLMELVGASGGKKRGAQPPRLWFGAPSRRTRARRQAPNGLAGRAFRADREGAARSARGGRDPQSN